MTSRRATSINDLIALEDQGRHDEARRLWEESTTPEERIAFSNACKLLMDADWETFSAIQARYRAALDNPDHPNAAPWLGFGDLTLPHLATFYERLLDPRASRGREAGTGPVSGDVEIREEIERRIAASGRRPTTVAREVLIESGHVGSDLKNRVDYLVKLRRKRGK